MQSELFALRSLSLQFWQFKAIKNSKLSLPLMRKTFIEAPQGAVMAAFNAQGLFRLCGRLSLRWGKSPRVRRILLFPPLLWRLSLRAGGVRIYPQLWFSAAYIADFHF